MTASEQKARTEMGNDLEGDSDPRRKLRSSKTQNLVGEKMDLKRTSDESEISKERKILDLEAKVIDLEKRNRQLTDELDRTKTKQVEEVNILKKKILDLEEKLLKVQLFIKQASKDAAEEMLQISKNFRDKLKMSPK